MLIEHRLPPAGGKKPKQVVMFLHGFGDSGSGGLLSIGEVWQRYLPECEFLCPDAPQRVDMAPPGFDGRQWFSLEDRSSESMLEGTVTAAPLLNEYIDHVLKTRNLPPDRLAIVGFSQGTMMALYTIPRRSVPVACIVGYSGKLIGGDTLSAEKRSTMPVLLAHGTADEIVPYVALGDAEQGLKKAGIPVTAITCPHTGHTIDDLGLVEGLHFIEKAFQV